MQLIKRIYWTLGQRQCRDTAIRVALIVGTILFTINHGAALFSHQMSGARWISALLTYCVPFMVSIHGQSTCQMVPEKRRL